MYREESALSPAPGERVVQGSNSLRGILRRHYPLLRGVWVILDVLIALLALFSLTYFVLGEVPRPYRVFAVFLAVVMLGVYRWSGLYERMRNRTIVSEIELLLSNMLVVIGGLILAGYLTGTLRLFDPNIIGAWVATTFFAHTAFHLSVRWIIHAARRRSFNVCRALIIGSGGPLEQIYQSLAASPWLGISVEGYVDTSDQNVSNLGSEVNGEERVSAPGDSQKAYQLPK